MTARHGGTLRLPDAERHSQSTPRRDPHGDMVANSDCSVPLAVVTRRWAVQLDSRTVTRLQVWLRLPSHAVVVLDSYTSSCQHTLRLDHSIHRILSLRGVGHTPDREP